MSSGSTLNYSFPYPLSTDPVDISGDIQQLAVKIDSDLSEIVQDIAAAQWTNGTFTNGILAPTYSEQNGNFSMSMSQNVSASGSPSFVDLGLSGSVTSGTWNANTIAAIKGGTGQTSYTVGDILYASASATLNKLIIGSNNHVLTSNGSAPVWTTNTGTGNVVRAESPTLSGTPLSTTASVDTNTTQIATTAYVVGQGYAKLASPTFTGTVSASLVSLSVADTATAASHYIVETGSDGIIRPKTLANVQTEVVTTSAVNSAAATTVGTITSGTWNATAIAAARGGTGLTSTPSNGQLLIGNGTGYTLATLTAGSNVTITNGSGSITISSTGGGGGDAGLQDILMFGGM